MALGSSVLVGKEHLSYGTWVLGRVHAAGLSSPSCLRVPWLWGGKGWSSPLSHSFPGCDVVPTAEPAWAIEAGGLGCASEGFERSILSVSMWPSKTIAEDGGALGG